MKIDAHRLYAVLTIALVVIISILVVILPTFFTGDISRVVLRREVKLPLIVNDNKDIKILFFGYSGCVDICTPRLQSLSKLYDSLDATTKNRVGVEFLDISTPVDRDTPDAFAKLFNKEFKGIYLERAVLRQYTKEFRVYFARSIANKAEFDHTATLYIVKRTNSNKEIRYIYSSYPYDSKQIKLDLQMLMSE